MDEDLSEGVTLEFLDDELARDMRSSLEAGLAAGAQFEEDGTPDDLFRAAVAQAIEAIEEKDRRKLLKRFLAIGPYVDGGPIPPQIAGQYMSDGDVAAAIRFIFFSVINRFQGQLAEMLAVGPVVRLAAELGRRRGGRESPQVHIGDSVKVKQLGRDRFAKGADFHLLDLTSSAAAPGKIRLFGLVEVKSYAVSVGRLWQQVERHQRRAQRGVCLDGRAFGADRIQVEQGAGWPAQVVVLPGAWRLPREFGFRTEGDRSFLEVEPAQPPAEADLVEEIGPGRWQVTLRWSQETLAQVAYEMTFWYMGELGRLLYAGGGRPAEWSEMTPEEAGRNAAKMMLYYAILRARTCHEESRAIALYNSYGFGYTLGSNFVDRRGRRKMLWFSDLREIHEHGRSRRTPSADESPAELCRIRGHERPGARNC